MSDLKILFKYPTRGRPERFFDGLDSIYNNINNKEDMHVLVSIDWDDPSMFNDEVEKRIGKYRNIWLGVGESASKVDAVNRDISTFPYGWDIIVVMSDDMRFTVFGFDDIIRQHVNAVFPDMDGLIHFPDQDAKGALNTMYIATEKYYKRFGYVYHNSYKSLWCDNESMDVAKSLGRYHFSGQNILVHLNPAYGHLPKDDLFNKQQDFWAEDEANYYRRKALNFPLSEQKEGQGAEE